MPRPKIKGLFKPFETFNRFASFNVNRKPLIQGSKTDSEAFHSSRSKDSITLLRSNR